MTDGLVVAAALLVVLVLLPAALGLASARLGVVPRGREALLRADVLRARATLAYYNDVHDSHSG